MYLYINYDDSNNKFYAVGLLPSTRGRPAKNHLGHSFVTDSGTEFSHSYAIVTGDEMMTAPNCEALKQTVITTSREHVSGLVIDPISLTLEMARAVHTVIGGIQAGPDAEVLPPSMRHQMRAVEDALTRLLPGAAENEAQLKEIKEILANNKKLFNVAMNTLNADWCVSNGLHTDRAAAPKKAEKSSTGESVSTAATVPVSFGFERLSGEKPELKVADPGVVEAEVHGVFRPKPDSTYIINDNTEQLFQILQVSRRHSPQNVNLIGPHGCGKTELAIQFAARCNMPMLIMDCANLREARDWFGYKTAREGTVYWHESQFVRAVEAGGHVILLDELNRANPHILNTLMPLLDGRRFTFLEEKGDKICVGGGTVFFATMNEGAGYTGTASLDRAFRDRFPRVVELTYLGEKDEIKLLVNRVGIGEDLATRLVQMANKIRQDATGLSATLTESISTRQLLAAACDFAIGGVETLQFTISNHFSPDGDDDSERVRVQNIIQGKFGDLLAAKAAKKGA